MLSIILCRAALGLTQGLALFLLYSAYDAKTWPATDGAIFAPLVLVSVFVPTILIAGLSNLRPRTLVIWAIVAAVLCIGLGIHDIIRAPTDIRDASRILPSAPLWWALTVGLFIAHGLIVAGDGERAYIASYPRYFDVIWTLGVQLALSAAFVGVFWGLLWLGADLFKLIQIDALHELIKRQWFSIPVTALALACALHVTDVQSGLVRGARTLALMLLAWLLPLMTLMIVAFLLALPFTGLEVLWSMRRATSIMLSAAAMLAVLVNAVYQDGQLQGVTQRVLRYVCIVAIVALVPLIGLAAYGLALRVEQYGWTPDRVFALGCVIVGAWGAIGYALAAARFGPSLKWIEATNVSGAFVALAILFALFTPIADPARIAVASQVARLEAGQVPPHRFDFDFLRFRSGRYGTEALTLLAERKEGTEAAAIAERARQALERTGLHSRHESVATPQMRATNITVVHPAGQGLPDSFLQQDWNADRDRRTIPQCLTRDYTCEAVLVDLDGDGQLEILLFGSSSRISSRWFGDSAFKVGPKGWTRLGWIENLHCHGLRDALRQGRFELVPPVMKDVEANGHRLQIKLADSC